MQTHAASAFAYERAKLTLRKNSSFAAQRAKLAPKTSDSDPPPASVPAFAVIRRLLNRTFNSFGVLIGHCQASGAVASSPPAAYGNVLRPNMFGHLQEAF
jgi:hypothetical protein